MRMTTDVSGPAAAGALERRPATGHDRATNHDEGRPAATPHICNAPPPISLVRKPDRRRSARFVVRLDGAIVAAAFVAALTFLTPGTAVAEIVFSGCVKDGKLIPRTLRADGEATCSAGEELVTWSQGVTTIAGLVGADGVTFLGSGFTTARIGPGEYRITFPPGTWRSFPVVTVSPFGLPGAFTAALVSHATGLPDGSAEVGIVVSSTLGVWTPHDVGFYFIAAASEP